MIDEQVTHTTQQLEVEIMETGISRAVLGVGWMLLALV